MNEQTTTLIFAAVIRFGTLGLLVYMAGVTVNLYEYLMRMAAYYDSREISLILAGVHDAEHAKRFAQFARVLAAEKIQFSKRPPTPTEELIELLKNAKGLSEKKKDD